MLAAEQMVLEENEMLINEGKRIGINEGKRISVINMLKKGYPIETISQITELSEKKIKEIIKSIKE